MAGAGAGEVLRGVGVYEGSISGSHIEIDRRPYHKNCSCALHASPHPKCPHHNFTHVSYPIRRSWSEGALSLYSSLSPHPHSSSSSSPSLHPPPPPPPPHRNHSNVGDQHLYVLEGKLRIIH